MWIRGSNPPFEKNGFAIFSLAVAVGAKVDSMVPVTVWAVAASMGAVTSSMWAVTAYKFDVQVL